MFLFDKNSNVIFMATLVAMSLSRTALAADHGESTDQLKGEVSLISGSFKSSILGGYRLSFGNQSFSTRRIRENEKDKYIVQNSDGIEINLSQADAQKAYGMLSNFVMQSHVDAEKNSVRKQTTYSVGSYIAQEVFLPALTIGFSKLGSKSLPTRPPSPVKVVPQIMSNPTMNPVQQKSCDSVTLSDLDPVTRAKLLLAVGFAKTGISFPDPLETELLQDIRYQRALATSLASITE